MAEYIDRLDASTIPVLPVEQRTKFQDIDEAFEAGWRQALEMVAMMEPADVVEREALQDKLIEVSILEWRGSHFSPKNIRAIPEEVLEDL